MTGMNLATHSQLCYSARHGNKKENPQISHSIPQEVRGIFSNAESLEKGCIKSIEIEGGKKESGETKTA